MGRYDGLNWQVLEIPFSAGLRTNTDVRARPSPALDIARDVQFDEVGGLQTRRPFMPMSNAIVGGGRLVNCRKLAVVNDELCVFTETAMYAWNPQRLGWVLRAQHMAVSVDTVQRFVSPGDQVAADRAELNGTIVYTWSELLPTTGANLFVAAANKETGAVLMGPTQLAVTNRGFETRLVVLATSILLFVVDGGPGSLNLTVRALDPANPAAGVAAAPITIASGRINGTFDVMRAAGQDLAVGALASNTTYAVFTVSSGLAVASTLKARTADGSIAVASRPPAGGQIHIFRSVSSGTQVLADVVNSSTLADIATGQVIGTYTNPMRHITACYRTATTGGRFVCRVFWSSAESAAGVDIKTNTIDDAGAIGTQATFVGGIGLASRAFDYGGAVFVHMVFALLNAGFSVGSSAQHTYFLYREDGALMAKAVPEIAGGYPSLTLSLPSVSLTSGSGTFSWASATRRPLSTGSEVSGLAAAGTAYGARALTDVTLSFDSNDARRMATLGRTAYVSGSEILQYDGVQLVECGFHIAGYSLSPTDAGVTSGNLTAGLYAYRPTYAWRNAQGEVERSTSTSISQVTINANNGSVTMANGSGPLLTTRKLSPAPAFEIWRSPVNPPPGGDVPFYLVTSQDPSEGTNPNRYLLNGAAIPSFTDNLSDASLTNREQNPENGGFLEPVSPPGARIVIATDARLWLAGVPGDPDRIWYSRERGDGQIASFHEELTVDVPQFGGAITAIWFQQGVLFISRESAIYELPGQPLDNLSQGGGFGAARLISSDVGAVSQEAQVLTPLGTVLRTRKGWYLIDNGGALRYVGGAVKAFDGDHVVAMTVMTGQHQVRILTDSRLLLWDYRGTVDAAAPDALGHWSEWTIADGLDATLWRGQYVYLTPSGPMLEQPTFDAGVNYGLDIETSWIKLAGLQGAARVRRVQPLGESRGVEFVRLRAAYNYDPTYVDDVAWAPPPASIGSPLQFSHGLSRPQCESVKIRITACREVQRASLSMTTLPIAILGGALWTTHIDALLPGELGNALVLEIAFVDGPRAVDVRDGLRFDLAIGAWMPARNVIGMRVTCRPGDELTTGDLTLALSLAGFDSKLYIVSMVDSRQEPIDIAAMLGQVLTGTFRGGAFGPPNNEALKLTSLGLEVGIEPGLFRLSKNQQA